MLHTGKPCRQHGNDPSIALKRPGLLPNMMTFSQRSWRCLSAHRGSVCSFSTGRYGSGCSVQQSTEAASSKILRKCDSFGLPSHGPHSHLLSLPNYLNVKVLSCTGMPLDSCLLELWGCAARRHRPEADRLSFLPHMGRPSGEVSTQPGEAGGIGLGTAGTQCDFSS